MKGRASMNAWFIKIAIMVIATQSVCQAHENRFHKIFPLNGFKLVVDTCMRSYSDALLLQDRIANHEKCDDLS